VRLSRGCPSPTSHLDQALLTRLLSGAEVADRGAIDHLEGCPSCRSRFESADPLRRLIAETTPVLAARRPVPLPPSTVGWAPRPPRRRWVAGLAAAASLALVALAASHRPSSPAPPPSPIAELTQVIRTAAQHHNQPGLQRALRNAEAELRSLGGAPVTDARLRQDLAVLQAQVRALPADTESAAVESDVEAALDDTGGQTGNGAAAATSTPTAGEAAPEPTAATAPLPTAPAAPKPTDEPGATTTAPAPSSDPQPSQDPGAPPPPDGSSDTPQP
jgi:hypothetical protein